MTGRPARKRLRALLAVVVLAAGACAVRPAEGREVTARVTVTVSEPGLEATADTVRVMAERTVERVERHLGLRGPERIDILLLRRPPVDSLERARYALGETPHWAAGLAQPGRQRIVLFTERSRSYPHRGLAGLLAHETSHLVLGARVPARSAPPRWYDEGLAMVVERELSLDDALRMARMMIVGRPVPLEELRRGWPASEPEARSAYVQSFSFVSFAEGRAAPQAPRALVDALSSGATFDQAFERAYGAPLWLVHREWQKSISWRYLTIPLIVAGTVINGSIGVLAVLAYAATRRRRRRRLEEWAREERFVDPGSERPPGHDERFERPRGRFRG